MEADECPVCLRGQLTHVFNGGRGCKKCCMAFRRFLAKPKPLKCLQNPRYCSPGEVDSDRLCRKCRIERCRSNGMVETRIHAVQPRMISTQPPFVDDRFPLATLISTEMEKNRRTMEHRYHNDGKLRGALEDDDHFISMQDQMKMGAFKMNLMIDSLSKLPVFKLFSIADLTDFAKHLAPYCFWIIDAFNGLRNAQKRDEKWLQDERNYYLPNTYMDKTERGFYTVAQRSLPGATQSDWKNIAQILKLRGALEDDDHFISMQDQMKMGAFKMNLMIDSLSKLPVFKLFSTADLTDFAKHLAPYCFWIIDAFNGLRNAQKRDEKWLQDERNYYLPNTYMDKTERGFYTVAQRSLPGATQSDWKNIAQIQTTCFQDPILRKQLAEYHFVDDNLFYLLLFLTFTHLSMEYSAVDSVKASYLKLKCRILHEMEMYYTEKSNVYPRFMIMRHLDFLAYVEVNAGQGRKILDMLTCLDLYISLNSNLRAELCGGD
uniref:Nuclear receptor domain-containing protein n=2 Tax=Steinernema glaseri TaxID=37863 RepID=A0A1I7ZZF2_9BILA